MQTITNTIVNLIRCTGRSSLLANERRYAHIYKCGTWRTDPTSMFCHGVLSVVEDGMYLREIICEGERSVRISLERKEKKLPGETVHWVNNGPSSAIEVSIAEHII